MTPSKAAGYYQLQGPLEMLVSINTFCDVSTNGEPAPTTDYGRQVEQWGVDLAARMPDAVMVWLDTSVCSSIQHRFDVQVEAGAFRDMVLPIGHYPVFIGFERAIVLPDGVPVHTIAAADGRLAAIGRRSPGHEAYIEYWHWQDGLILTKAMEVNELPATNMLYQAMIAILAGVHIGDESVVTKTHRPVEELERIRQKAARGGAERARTMWVPRGGLYELTLVAAWDGQRRTN